ncbi:hypothetical protein ACJX0J_008228 [Zea mays]
MAKCLITGTLIETGTLILWQAPPILEKMVAHNHIPINFGAKYVVESSGMNVFGLLYVLYLRRLFGHIGTTYINNHVNLMAILQHVDCDVAADSSTMIAIASHLGATKPEKIQMTKQNPWNLIPKLMQKPMIMRSRRRYILNV